MIDILVVQSREVIRSLLVTPILRMLLIACVAKPYSGIQVYKSTSKIYIGCVSITKNVVEICSIRKWNLEAAKVRYEYKSTS